MADEAYPIAGESQITTLAEWEAFFTAVQEVDGVVTGLDPSLNAGDRTAAVSPGAAYLRGFYKPVSSTTSTAIPAADTQARIDRLVLRLDRSQDNTPADFCKFVVLTGTPGSNQPPALTRQTSSTGIYDLPICRWTSGANGSLTGLTDERIYVGGGFRQAARAAGVLPAYPPRLGVEVETGSVYRSNGSVWAAVFEDTGWVSLSPNGPNGNAWTNNAVSEIRLKNGIVQLRFSIQRWSQSGLGTDDTDGSTPFVLPAQYRPLRDQWGTAHVISNRSSVAVKIEDTGQVVLYPVDRAIPASRTVQGTVMWMVG